MSNATTRRLKPRKGQHFGTTDGAPPKTYNQLSRLHDVLRHAEQISHDLRSVLWLALPRDLQIEFNYSKWSYVDDIGVV